MLTASSAWVAAGPAPGDSGGGPGAGRAPGGPPPATAEPARPGGEPGRKPPERPRPASSSADPSPDRPPPAASGSPSGGPFDRYRMWAKDWRARRDVYRKARLKRLRYRLDRALHGQPIPAELRAELDAHARLMARLNRIKEVAIEKGDDQTIHRADELMRKETERHDRAIGARGSTGRGEAAAGGAIP